MKVADLAGRQLDYWVDKGEGLPDLGFDFFEAGGGPRYSMDWSSAGPIIERERIYVRPYGSTLWIASYQSPDPASAHIGVTPTEAAMRCYVAHCFGAEVGEE